jgi:uncharacterized coiled-coil protein SlyX
MNDERKMVFISMGFDAVIERCAMLEDHIAELEAKLSNQHHVVDSLRITETQMIAKIQRLEAECRWIPVEERLPANGKHILILIKGRLITGLYQWNAWLDESGTGISKGITHWMPIEPLEG